MEAATGFSDPPSPAQTVASSSTHSPAGVVEPPPKRPHTALPALPKAPSVESVRSSRSRARVRAETVALAEARVALAEARLEAAREDSDEECLSSAAGDSPAAAAAAMATLVGPCGQMLYLHADNVWREEQEPQEQQQLAQQAQQALQEQHAQQLVQLQQQHQLQQQ